MIVNYISIKRKEGEKEKRRRKDGRKEERSEFVLELRIEKSEYLFSATSQLTEKLQLCTFSPFILNT